MLDEYDNINFINIDGSLNLKTNTVRVSEYFEKNYGVTKPYDSSKTIKLGENSFIFPHDWLCSYKKGVSYAVHHFNYSWGKSKKESFLQKLFSVKNDYSNGMKYKKIRILGFKITIKRANYDTINSKLYGKNIIIQDHCRIYNAENISIGNNVLIGQGALIEGMGGLSIGNNVVFGPDVTIWTANHNYNMPVMLPYDERVIYKSVTIQDNVWLGAKCIIIPGVTIHEGAVIGIGAVVTKDVPKGAVVGGNPAKVIKYRDLDRYDKLCEAKSFYDLINGVK